MFEVDNSQELTILNTLYSVFLGVILSFSFYVDTSSSPTVCLVFDFAKRPEYILFALYFLVDWITVNTVRKRGLPSIVSLWFRILWLAILGFTVISLNGSGQWKFFFLSVYLMGSGLFDVVLMLNVFKNNNAPEHVFGLLLASIRLVFGLIFIVPLVMIVIGRNDVVACWDNPNSAKDMIFSLCLIYLLLKACRVIYLEKIGVTANE